MLSNKTYDVLKWIAMYLLPAMGDVMQGFFRGIGKLNVSLFGTIFQISIRVALTYLLAGSLGLVSVSIATGTGWCLFLIILAVLYRREKPRVRLSGGFVCAGVFRGADKKRRERHFFRLHGKGESRRIEAAVSAGVGKTREEGQFRELSEVFGLPVHRA